MGEPVKICNKKNAKELRREIERDRESERKGGRERERKGGRSEATLGKNKARN